MANLFDVPPSPSDAAHEQVCMARTLRVDSPSLSRSWMGQVPHGLGVGRTPWAQECHRFPSGVNEAALLGGVLLSPAYHSYNGNNSACSQKAITKVGRRRMRAKARRA